MELNEETYFAIKDIASIVGHSGGKNLMTINEAGLYSLLFMSKLEYAKAFKCWFIKEVLPNIKKEVETIPTD